MEPSERIKLSTSSLEIWRSLQLSYEGESIGGDMQFSKNVNRTKLADTDRIERLTFCVTTAFKTD